MRVSLFITSPEGELSETAMLIPTGGPDVYPPEVRTQLENLVADCLEQAGLSAAEAIEQIDVPHLGGHWVPQLPMSYMRCRCSVKALPSTPCGIP